MPDAPPFNAPAAPTRGQFQTVEWSNARGYWLIRDMTAAERAAAFPPPDPTSADPTAANVRAEGARRIRAAVAAANEGVEYSIEEMLTWPEQTLAVVQYLDDPAPTDEAHPLLASLAAGRSITTEEMATRIAAKRLAYQAIAQAILTKQAEILRIDPLPVDFDDDARWLL